MISMNVRTDSPNKKLPIRQAGHHPRGGSQMVVPINGRDYQVVIVPGPLMVRGVTAASRVRHDKQVIEVDDIIPATDRWRVAALAVAYACRRANHEKFKPIRVLGGVD